MFFDPNYFRRCPRRRCREVAGEFDEGVLKARRSEEWPVAAAGELDALEHAVKTFVGTAG